ncbi:MAG: hypothetical protein U0105_27520 [Candidatus Obscuribacterales bacterium]
MLRASNAADIAAVWLPGKSRSDILAVLGKPTHTEGPICLPTSSDDSWNTRTSDWTAARSADENLIYNVGGTYDQYLLISLSEGRCTSAQHFGFGKYFDYAEWKAWSCLKFASGIDYWEQPICNPHSPTSIAQNGKGREEIWNAFGKPNRVLEEYGAEVWNYDFCDSSVACLTIKDGKCVSGALMTIFH